MSQLTINQRSTTRGASLLLFAASLCLALGSAQAEERVYRPNVTLCEPSRIMEPYLDRGYTSVRAISSRFGTFSVVCPLLPSTPNASSLLVRKVSAFVVDSDGRGTGQYVNVQVRSHTDNDTFPFKAIINSNNVSGPSSRWISTGSFTVNPQAESTYVIVTLYRAPGAARPALKGLRVEYAE
ncbi:MAG: hypothetical protein MJE66_02625 [Proteobacteria bacterium]|nr:hypothetical protein [Pseudomonadota bacterium]